MHKSLKDNRQNRQKSDIVHTHMSVRYEKVFILHTQYNKLSLLANSSESNIQIASLHESMSQYDCLIQSSGIIKQMNKLLSLHCMARCNGI